MVAAAISATASSTAGRVAAEMLDSPPTLRTYCNAAAWISSGVAAGSSPRRAVMFRHIPRG
ncbi:Uncharacterised protein [Mycobacteroides abscessus subsp. abscessus]|nr:Uncharacterised protein [Mycobacteroides abscessus subsp. abscessus]